MFKIFNPFFSCLARPEFLGNQEGGGGIAQLPEPGCHEFLRFPRRFSSASGYCGAPDSAACWPTTPACRQGPILPFARPSRCWRRSHSCGTTICGAAVTPTAANAFQSEGFPSITVYNKERTMSRVFTKQEISAVAAAMGRKGSRKKKAAGAKAQAQRMTEEQLKARASKAGKAGAKARWGKRS